MEAIDRIQVVQGDLTEMDVDAIVNAANNDLVLGAGVAGAILRKGGERIQRECNRIGAIPVGTSAMTSGGKLKARWVIHAASMELGGATTAETLRGSTTHALHLARQREFKTIAFPAIGTGIGGFPLHQCAEIMLGEALEHLRQRGSLDTVYFVLYDRPAFEEFQEVREELKEGRSGRSPSAP